MVTLVKEDGSIVANANTYVDQDEFLTYIDNRGLSLSAASDSDYIKTLLIRACDYIEAQRALFQGTKTDDDQSLQFPRDGVYVDGILVGNDSIPRELKYAQMRLAYDADTHSDLSPVIETTEKGSITREKVGDLEVAYASNESRRSTPAFTEAENLLRPLYKARGMRLIKA